MSCSKHTTPAFGCSGCIDARKRGEWESAPVRKVRHVWQVPPLREVSVTSELRVPDGLTERDVERAHFTRLFEYMLDDLKCRYQVGVSVDAWRKWWPAVLDHSRLLSLSIGAAVEQAPEPEPEPIADQPSLFGGDS
jgi:hypothetical protein